MFDALSFVCSLIFLYNFAMNKGIGCAFPNFHLQIKPGGITKPCCRFIIDDDLARMGGNANLSDYLTSDYWSNLRKTLEKGLKPSGCSKCFNEEDSGQFSMRLTHEEAEKKLDYNTRENIDLIDLEVGFSNICNLACRSCDSNLSTRWYEDDQKLTEAGILERGRPKVKIKPAFNDLKNLSIPNTIKSVKFTGGEPFLHKELPIFLDKMVKMDISKNVELRFCTNGTILPSDQIIDTLKKFKSIDFSLSLDGIEKANDYLRYPSRWDEILKVIEKLKALVKEDRRFSITRCTTVSIYSLEILDKMESWWNSFVEDIPHEKGKSIYQMVHAPSYLSPEIVPKEIMEEFDVPASVKNMFTGLKSGKETLNLFKTYTQSLDELRGEDFENVFPKLSKLIDQYEF